MKEELSLLQNQCNKAVCEGFEREIDRVFIQIIEKLFEDIPNPTPEDLSKALKESGWLNILNT